MSNLAFTKMQGVGNDFVVIDGREMPEEDWSTLAVRLCDRKFGVGADGLLVLDFSEKADFLMRMYNPDGSADVCGNGLRCIARYAVERQIVAEDRMQIETLMDVREAVINRNSDGEFTSVTVDMREPRFAPADIPVQTGTEVSVPVLNFPLSLPDGECVPITALSTGSTHAIALVASLPEDARFFAISPQVENHPFFPERTSLMWYMLEGPNRLRLRIWERGAGETWGCGTGACAAAVAAILHGYVAAGEPITVASKGGELQVHWKQGESIRMTGPAEFVFEGEWR